MRSLAFSEFEMTSHPLIFLTVVASSDVDHVGCMQELSSSHHIPSCFNTVRNFNIDSFHFYFSITLILTPIATILSN